jgi:hypothetical protein
MGNTNCLAGMRCPKCKSERKFLIRCSALMAVTDEGTDYCGDAETDWEDDSFCACCDCDMTGEVKDFRIKTKRKAVKPHEK